ncbi:dynein axonemal assembly factor 10 [Anabrus simplex]|uniref:dynein axonemal assembly factor 10 n=1 Tax=Anabrus simplex TaxID=316456 RepID=UPI0034DD47DC
MGDCDDEQPRERSKYKVSMPQILSHTERSVDYTVYCGRWLPNSALFVTLGCRPNFTGVMELNEVGEKDVSIVKKVENKKAFKCGEAGGSQNVNSAFCTGNFGGRLDVWDMQNTTYPVFSCTEHGDIISSIDTVGGGIPGWGSPEILTCSKDGLVKVWDTRVKSSVATIGPDSGEARRECWTACFGNAYNSEQRVIAAGYDNGDIKIYDLRIMSIKYETHCLNGVCCVEFDRKDIPINKIVATTLESGILVYDVSRQTKNGYPCRKEKARVGTVWLVRHLPQNREVFVTCGGSGEVTLWQYHYPEQRYKKDADGVESTVVGSIEEVQNADIASQPIISYDWNASRQGLAVCTALDQAVRVLIVTKLNEL